MHKVLHSIRDIALLLPGGEYLYRWSVNWRESRRHKRDCRILQMEGADLLRLVFERFNDKIPYFLTYGNLLGCVRENAFLKHDDDIDMGIMPGVRADDVIRALEDSELKYVGSYIYKGRVTQIGYTFRKMHVDFFMYFKDGDDFNAYTCIDEPGVAYGEQESGCRLYIEPAVVGLKRVDFLGAKAYIPENAEEMLSVHYGPNWRKPDPGWVPIDIEGHYKSKMMPGTMRYAVSKEEVLKLFNA